TDTAHAPRPEPGALDVLVLCASRRAGSLNGHLAELAARTIEATGLKTRQVNIKEVDTPSYDDDSEHAGGLPPGAEEFAELLRAANALVIASPEYNASMPGMLKNLIDWVSRLRPQPFNELQTLLMSASPSMSGGNRGLWALRVPLEHLGARVYPDMFSLAQAHTAFGADGRIADATLQARFEGNVQNFVQLAEAAVHYPCAKKAWVEFLGERAEFEGAEEQLDR
ncbi:NAD(P)H-dependent oxidoreductase, partial [Actinospica durhamensis]